MWILVLIVVGIIIYVIKKESERKKEDQDERERLIRKNADLPPIVLQTKQPARAQEAYKAPEERKVPLSQKSMDRFKDWESGISAIVNAENLQQSKEYLLQFRKESKVLIEHVKEDGADQEQLRELEKSIEKALNANATKVVSQFVVNKLNEIVDKVKSYDKFERGKLDYDQLIRILDNGLMRYLMPEVKVLLEKVKNKISDNLSRTSPYGIILRSISDGIDSDFMASQAENYYRILNESIDLILNSKNQYTVVGRIDMAAEALCCLSLYPKNLAPFLKSINYDDYLHIINSANTTLPSSDGLELLMRDFYDKETAARKEYDIDNKISYYKAAIESYQALKALAYNLGEAQKLYFEQNQEHHQYSKHPGVAKSVKMQEEYDHLVKYRDEIFREQYRLKNIYATLDQDLIDIIAQEPGILQTQIYKRFDSDVKSEIQRRLADMDFSRRIGRVKKGNTYELYVP